MVITSDKQTPRRRLPPEARRLEILEAAERLLESRGPAVRVEDIVAAAHAAKGTFYLYFQTFDDLLEAIRDRKARELEAIVAPLLLAERSAGWQRLLPDIATAFVSFVLSLGGLHEVLFHSAFTQARPMPQERRPAARIAAIIRAGRSAGVYADVDPEPTAALIFAVMHEAADAIAAGADRERTLAALERMLHAAVLVEIPSIPPPRS